MPDGWVRSDAWIFAAIAATHADASAGLADVIGAADVLERAIPTGPELQQAVRRLSGSDLIVTEGDHFGLTPSGQRLWQRPRRGGLFSQVDQVLAALERHHSLDEGPSWTLPDGEPDRAYRVYLSRHP